ncbi:hypothetical protein CRUP_000953, partial [Coryphaenoides rupestris]
MARGRCPKAGFGASVRDSTCTWTIRNETHTGATLKYVPKEVEEIVTCTISNPLGVAQTVAHGNKDIQVTNEIKEGGQG